MNRLPVIILLLCAAATRTAVAADDDRPLWQAGAASVVITPEAPMWMAG